MPKLLYKDGVLQFNGSGSVLVIPDGSAASDCPCCGPVTPCIDPFTISTDSGGCCFNRGTYGIVDACSWSLDTAAYPPDADDQKIIDAWGGTSGSLSGNQLDLEISPTDSSFEGNHDAFGWSEALPATITVGGRDYTHRYISLRYRDNNTGYRIDLGICDGSTFSTSTNKRRFVACKSPATGSRSKQCCEADCPTTIGTVLGGSATGTVSGKVIFHNNGCCQDGNDCVSGSPDCDDGDCEGTPA
jgi:hypothetical protein